jgi:uncharacterized membrane protein YtjA (UPF0391 family)
MLGRGQFPNFYELSGNGVGVALPQFPLVAVAAAALLFVAVAAAAAGCTSAVNCIEFLLWRIFLWPHPSREPITHLRSLTFFRNA